MRIPLLLLVAFYFVIATLLVRSWLRFYFQDKGLSPTTKVISIFIIAIAALLWPLAVPIAYLELLNKIQQSKIESQIASVLESPGEQQFQEQCQERSEGESMEISTNSEAP